VIKLIRRLLRGKKTQTVIITYDNAVVMYRDATIVYEAMPYGRMCPCESCRGMVG
jgi:hypothetical protein